MIHAWNEQRKKKQNLIESNETFLCIYKDLDSLSLFLNSKMDISSRAAFSSRLKNGLFVIQ